MNIRRENDEGALEIAVRLRSGSPSEGSSAFLFFWAIAEGIGDLLVSAHLGICRISFGPGDSENG